MKPRFFKGAGIAAVWHGWRQLETVELMDGGLMRGNCVIGGDGKQNRQENSENMAEMRQNARIVRELWRSFFKQK